MKSGVSVVVGDAPMVAGLHVMGGAPGTRESTLLAPDATVPGVDALVLSGGSAFGRSSKNEGSRFWRCRLKSKARSKTRSVSCMG